MKIHLQVCLLFSAAAWYSATGADLSLAQLPQGSLPTVAAAVDAGVGHAEAAHFEVQAGMLADATEPAVAVRLQSMLPAMASGTSLVDFSKVLSAVPWATWAPWSLSPFSIGALIITNAILGAPCYNHSRMGPQNPILIIKAPIL